MCIELDASKTQEMWDKTYASQRKDRLTDIISDFMGDDSITADDFYASLMEDIDNNINYYESQANKYRNLKQLIM